MEIFTWVKERDLASSLVHLLITDNPWFLDMEICKFVENVKDWDLIFTCRRRWSVWLLKHRVELSLIVAVIIGHRVEFSSVVIDKIFTWIRGKRFSLKFSSLID